MLGYDKEDNWFWVLLDDGRIGKTTNVKFYDTLFKFPKDSPTKAQAEQDIAFQELFVPSDEPDDPEHKAPPPVSNPKAKLMPPRNLIDDFNTAPEDQVTPTSISTSR